MKRLPYSIVIATYERADALRNALESVTAQTHLPERVIIVDSSAGHGAQVVAEECDLPVKYERAERPSAAVQRNQGFQHVETPLVAFMDDDVVLAPDTFARLCAVFDELENTGGVAARMNGAEHPAPNRSLRKYYRVQAGFDHPTYGGRLFGAAINCFPCYSLQREELIPADWLNLGCVVFRSDLFGAELFPLFGGYSYGEDVHLSARIGQKARLYFHSAARYDHFPSMSPAKRNPFRYARMSARHRRLIARDIQGLRGWELTWKDLFHRLFVTVYLVRSRPAGWFRQIAGELAVSLRVAVTIASHNRRNELARTLTHLARLDPAPDEILVCADGCSDGTLELLEEHPSVRSIVHEQAAGSIPSRNELARACQAEIMVSLDDDSYPLDPDFVQQVRSYFARRPRVAVVGFAQRSDEFPETLARTEFGHAQFVGSYANSGAAIRTDVFLELGGYPELFFHAYEEPDFALRCLCAGWQVRYEPSLLVRHHFTGSQRNEIRTHQRHARNEFWSVILRCPTPQVFPVALFRALRQFGYAARRGPKWVLQEPRWWAQAIGGIARCLQHRQPLPWKRYLAWMRLIRRPIESEVEWNALFGSAAH